VEQFIEKKRKQPRRPNREELAAIASFLMHPEIGLLSEEELNEPEIPYRFAKFLLDFLAYPGQAQLYPPKELSGRYLSVLKDTNGSSRRRVELILEVRERDHVIRAFEVIFERETSEFETTCRANGWGVITPEGNLFLFMKRKQLGYNHYYFTVALHPDFWSGAPATELALLRHAYPVPQTPDSRTLPDLIKETDGDTVLLQFNKIADTDTASEGVTWPEQESIRGGPAYSKRS
jgi:hypothetical protein